jgi:hypothetical protein
MTTTLSARPKSDTPLRDLLMLLGPEETASLVGDPTPEDLAATAAFRAKLATMSDNQVREQWGINSNDLIRDLRELFAD